MLEVIDILTKHIPNLAVDVFVPYGRFDRSTKILTSDSESFDISCLNNVIAVHIGQPPESIQNTMCRTDILLLPSHYESFSLAALEATTCGATVVCREIPALRELSRVFTDAFKFVDGSDPMRWATTCIESLDKRAPAHRLSQASSSYSAALVAQCYDGLYERARSTTPASPICMQRTERDVITIVSPEDGIRKTGGIGTWADTFRASILNASTDGVIFFRCAIDVDHIKETWLSDRSLHVDWPLLCDPAKITTLTPPSTRVP